ncbi:MAG: hypothetical protein ACLGI2_05815 [Acidimicrobiia bacterium]
MDATFDPRTLWQLRVAASLATALPVRVLVTDGADLLFEVRRPEVPADPGRALVPPCWFRAMVASARSTVAMEAGPLSEAMLGARRLRIRPVLDHAGSSLPGGIWRLDHSSSATYVFASGLTEDAARVAAGADAPAAALEPGFLADPATGVTLVSATAGSTADPAAVLDVVHGMLAGCVAAELLAEMATGAERS